MITKIEAILNIKGEQAPSRPDVFVSDINTFDNHLFNIKSYFSYIWLLDISFVKKDNQVRLLRYLFLDVESGYDFIIEFSYFSNQKVKSITHLWRNSSSIEQRIFSIHGVKFTRAYKHLYLQDKEEPKKNLISLYGEKQLFQRIVNSNPLSQNNQGISVFIENDNVKKCEVDSGNFHIGFESILEINKSSQKFHFVESYLPLKASFWANIMSVNYESQNELILSDRSKAIRMILLELSRVMNHVNYFLSLSRYYKFSGFYDSCRLWMKTIQSLFLSYTGNEFGIGVIRPGGLIKDISQVWLTRTASEIVSLERSMLNVYKSIILKESTKDEFSYSLVSKKMASSWSLSGPIVRAVGINLDCRKLKPNYFYDFIDFEVPVGTQGRAYDLILVKMEEMFQSLKIIVQVLDNLPTGSIMNENINEFVVVNSLGKDLEEDRYRSSVNEYLSQSVMDQSHYIESSNGIFGISELNSNDQVNLNVMTNELALKSLFEKSVTGNPIEYIAPLWEVMGIDLKEVER